ncbi:uncharacterized protein L201_007369 [Kwoniella dendrophila CBS 6074]|uniref:Zn(2)-C6 fungal-type domain-containing protein n=1 Tax=Kwoniella dendrophila CBS 6074 TaxID=1295534 RepID=A0AAX4K6C6_9TREE
MAPMKHSESGPSQSNSDGNSNADNRQSEAPKKQRKLNRTLPQLKRNAACLPCRRRRIKCDAGKPHCSSCVRSYHFLARTQPDEERDSKGVQCYYDEDAEEADDEHHHHVNSKEGSHDMPADGSSPHDILHAGKRKHTALDEDPRAVIKKLEEKVAELQNALSSTSTPAHSSATSASVMPNATFSEQPQTQLANETSSWAGPSPNQFPADFLSAPYNPPVITTDPSTTFPFDSSSSAVFDPINSGSGVSAPPPVPTAARRSTQAISADEIDAEAGRFSGPFLDILFPGWPANLPTPSMLDHLVETFFNMVPSVPRVLHRQSFLARLALPPTHTDFPHVALLHAICASAARYTAAVKCRSVAESVEKTNQDAKRANGKGLPYDDPADETCFSERNARYAFAAMRYEHVSGRGLLDLLQAMCIMGHWGQANAKWIEGWIIVGAGGRLSICLGLMDHQPDDFGMPALRQSILGPPKDDAEREERRAVMYYVMVYDAISAASSGWPNTLPVDEITARMPCHRRDFENSENMTENPQYYHSPDLFVNHPVADGFNMMLKGMILLSRACKFILKTTRKQANLPSVHFPPALRDPVQYLQGHAKGVDADLIAAHLIPRIASIFLHEPFADISDPGCQSATRLLMEARAVLNIVYLVVSSNADISYMVVPICSCDYFFTAARTLLLFFQRALEIGDTNAAYAFRSEIAVFKMAFQALSNRYAMGARHLIMIEMVVSHVEEETLGHPLPDNDYAPPRLPAQPPAWQVAYPEMRRAYGSTHHRATSDPIRHPDTLAVNKMNEIRKDRLSGKDSDMTVTDVINHRRHYVNSPQNSNHADGASPNGGCNNSPGSPAIWVHWQSVASHRTEGQLPPQLQDPNLRTEAQILDPKFRLL